MVFMASGHRSVTTLDSAGRMQEVHFFGEKDRAAKAEAVAAELGQIGPMILTGGRPQETGYWNPASSPRRRPRHAGRDGARAIHRLAIGRQGGSRPKRWPAEATSGPGRQEGFVRELKLPMAFTDGDEADVRHGHNDAIEKGTIQLTLKTIVGSRTTEEKRPWKVKSKGLHEVAFKNASSPAGSHER